MALSQDLGEFIAGLTWPLRGRKAVKEVERRIQEDLRVLRWEELHAVRREIGQVQSEAGRAAEILKSEIGALAHQLQMQQNYLQALEKLMRGNFSHLHDRITTFQDSENAIKEDVSAAFDKIAALRKIEAAPR